MGMPVETEPGASADALRLRLLGPVSLSRNGVALALPASRKVRALLGYLAVSPHPVSRSHLCELLWDVPNDPRGELRWCLSKLRGVLDQPGRRRVETQADSVRLDLSDCAVDATGVEQGVRQGIGTLSPATAQALLALFGGDFLEGLEIDRSPFFDAWLAAQRRRFRGFRLGLLEHLARTSPDGEALAYLNEWLRLSPFDLDIHERLLASLARNGRIADGDEHVAAASKQFEAEGLDPAPLREAWRRARAASAPRSRAGAAPLVDPGDSEPATQRRGSIAVMPFTDPQGGPEARGGLAGGLVYDVITRLAKLRALFVIAQGTVFALHERGVGPQEAGRLLNVDYVVSGTLRRRDARLEVAVELSETRSDRIVWAEVFTPRRDDALAVLDEIGDRIVASIASEIETLERNRAVLRPPNSLDAWGAHHRGLWHMYRFNKTDNERAQQFFETAVRLDPTFARAHAGLSFTHFQNAFQRWKPRGPEIDLAFARAGQSMMADDRDPAAHWAMGRALWLRGDHDQSVSELEEAVGLSPNFAQGYYALAFVESQAGDASAAIRAADQSRMLSPFDPLLFGMLGARAMALLRLGRFAEAADWAIKAAARPNAHAHILAIAAYALGLAGRTAEGRSYLSAIHKTQPRYGVSDLLAAMQFAPEDQRLFREGARHIGGR